MPHIGYININFGINHNDFPNLWEKVPQAGWSNTPVHKQDKDAYINYINPQGMVLEIDGEPFEIFFQDLHLTETELTTYFTKTAFGKTNDDGDPIVAVNQCDEIYTIENPKILLDLIHAYFDDINSQELKASSDLQAPIYGPLAA